MLKKKWLWGVVLGVAIIALVLVNLGNAGKAPTAKVAEVTEGELVEKIYANGRLEPVSTTEIFSSVSGIVNKLEVKVGDTLTKGQALLTVKIDGIKEQIEKEKLGMELIEAQRLDAKKKHYEQFKQQFAEDPDAQVEELDLTSLDLQIQTAQLNISLLEKQLNNSTVYATTEGVVTQVAVKEGQMIAEGIELIQTADLSSFKVKSNINELDSGKVVQGMKAVITSDSFTDTYEGEISYLSPTAVLADAASKDATVEIEITLNKTGPELRSGYNVAIEIEIPDKPRILVPMGAIQYEDEETYVYKVVEEHAVKSKVTLGKEGEEQIEVTSGVAKGDKVIVEGATGLRDGDKVKVQ